MSEPDDKEMQFYYLMMSNCSQTGRPMAGVRTTVDYEPQCSCGDIRSCSLWHYIDVSNQLHAVTASFLEKEPLIRTGYEADRSSESVWMQW
jgi:hypothetical protein